MGLSQRVKNLEKKLSDLSIDTGENQLSDYDVDCLCIVKVASFTTAQAAPDYSVIQATTPWKHGWELKLKLAPIIPSHLDPLYGKRCWASYWFEAVTGRLPSNGDILRFQDLVEEFHPEVYDQKFNVLCADAWKRQLGHLPYPLKWSRNRLYMRTRVGWEKHHSQFHPEYRWSDVEVNDLSQSVVNTIIPPDGLPNMPTVPAVTFWIAGDGSHKVTAYKDGAAQ